MNKANENAKSSEGVRQLSLPGGKVYDITPDIKSYYVVRHEYLITQKVTFPSSQ